MKPQPLLIAALGLIVVALWLQGRWTAADVQQLRARQQVMEQSAAFAQRSPTTEAATRNSSGADFERPVPAGELAEAQARIAELERDLTAVAESLNTAIERINRSAVEAQRALEPAWSAGQAVGEPDTMTAGDQRTAWAPATADGGTEWLQLGYENAVEIAQVRVRETCGAGSISKVAAILEGGREVVIWQGRQEPGEGIVEAPFNAPSGLTAAGVKVYLDTGRVAGWNEVDAVELIGRDGSRQWAKTSSASSSYGSGGSGKLYDLGGDTPLNLELSTRRLTR